VQHKHTAVFRALRDASADLTTDRIRAAVALGSAESTEECKFENGLELKEKTTERTSGVS